MTVSSNRKLTSPSSSVRSTPRAVISCWISITCNSSRDTLSSRVLFWFSSKKIYGWFVSNYEFFLRYQCQMLHNLWSEDLFRSFYMFGLLISTEMINIFFHSIWFFPNFTEFSDKNICQYNKRARICRPSTSRVRDQDATTVPAWHLWETRSFNWAQFMLQWFIRYPEFAELSEFPFHLGRTPMGHKNLRIWGNQMAWIPPSKYSRMSPAFFWPKSSNRILLMTFCCIFKFFISSVSAWNKTQTTTSTGTQKYLSRYLGNAP